jgi:uncharacterized protein (TIGR02594 family)
MTPYDFAKALHRYGVKEIPGKPENPLIRAFHYSIGLVANEDTAWCGSFVGFCHKTTAYELPKGPSAARSWLNAGEVVASLDLALPGDVIILWRGSKDGWQGHVGFYERHTTSLVTLLGGNQGDELSIASFGRDRLLGIRRPRSLSTNALHALTSSHVLFNPTTA